MSTQPTPYRRMVIWLSGREDLEKRALPAGEFLHPAPLACVALLILNDFVLKGASILPPAITGKLSDLFGLFFFPLLLTAGTDSLAQGAARLGLWCDFSLRRWKLRWSIGATGLGFALLKLSSPLREIFIGLYHSVGASAQVVADPTDLLALPVLWLSWRMGRREIARCPLGRLEWAQGQLERDLDIDSDFFDLIRCGADPRCVKHLLEALKAPPSQERKRQIRHIVDKLRGVSL